MQGEVSHGKGRRRQGPAKPQRGNPASTCQERCSKAKCQNANARYNATRKRDTGRQVEQAPGGKTPASPCRVLCSEPKRAGTGYNRTTRPNMLTSKGTPRHVFRIYSVCQPYVWTGQPVFWPAAHSHGTNTPQGDELKVYYVD